MTMTQLKYVPIGTYSSMEVATTAAKQMTALNPGQEWIWCRDVRSKMFRIVRVV